MREVTHRPGRFARYVEQHRLMGSFHLWLLQALAVFLPVPTQSPTRWAFFRGYFWLPCHICGEWQSGLDWTTTIEGRESTVPTGRYTGRGICRACALDGVGDRAWRAFQEAE